MPRDTQIFSGSSESGSKDYTLPGNSELLLLAVNANFVDNGAGSNWCPAVVLFSDSGHVISRAVNKDDPVTAGDDAEVSWFPGVKPGGGVAGLPSCSCSIDIGTGDFAFGNHDLPILSFATTAPSIFSTPGGGSSLVYIGQNGFYLVSGSVTFDIAQEITQLLNLYVVQDDALGWNGALDVIGNDPGHVSNVQYLHGVTFASMTATDFISLELQTEADITNVNAASLAITQLNPRRLL